MYTFFESNKIADNKLTYLSTFANNGYTFNNISGLIRHMAEAKVKGLQSNPNWLALHPDWNKVVLSAVTMTKNKNTGSVVVVRPDFALSSAALVGGTQPLKMQVLYSSKAK
jgi:hypothetical protein